MADVKEIELSRIDVPTDRARADLGNIHELALSLKERGQLQNLVVRAMPDGTYKLLAGARRVAAMKLNGEERAFCLVFDRDLDEYELLSIELEENLRRKNFTWEEEVTLKKRIFTLAEEKFGRKKHSGDTKGVSMTEVAKSLDISPATMSLDISLAKAVEATPNLFEGCKNKSEARKRLAKLSEMAVQNEVKRQIEASPIAPKVKNIVDRYIVWDFFDGIKEIPEECVNFVEIDLPPSEVDVKAYLPLLEATLKECNRVMTTDSWLILWCPMDPWGPHVRKLIEAQGFETTGLTGKWIKPTGYCGHPEKWLVNACEEFFYCRKGRATIVRQGRTNIFTYPDIPATKKIHPAEKPVDLLTEIYSTFTWEGSRVLIPFLGAGIGLIVAELLKMSAFGYASSDREVKQAFSARVGELAGQGVIK